MISKEEITAVIPTYNRLLELDRCIKSIYPYVKEIIVIDNNSYESISALEKKYENVHVYSMTYNMGPCAATNFGIKQSDTPYILLVDNDAELLAKVDPWSIVHMDENQAIMAFRILDDKYFHMYAHLPPEYDQQLPWFYGCACLVNKKAWEEVRGYNEDYFAYYQECDISAKFWKKNYYIYYNPSIVFAHHNSTVERNPNSVSYWKTRNATWFCMAHLPFWTAAYTICKTCISSLSTPKEMSKGLIDALKNMPKRDPIKDEFFLKVWRR
jgi:GT2 family glycosyltransferase